MRGLVLEGGGVKGAYHIGVLTALREAGLADFDGYVGTSIGAVNSAMLCAGDWNKTMDFWNNINVQNTLNMDEYTFSRITKGKFDRNALENVGQIVSNLGGFIDTTTDKMRLFIRNYIDEDAIRKSTKDFGLVTYSVPDFQPHYMMKDDIPKGQIADYVIASAAYPTFKWQKIEGMENKWFIDGGIYDNMPVKMLVERGYDEIIAIRTNIKKYIGFRKVDAGDAKITYFTPSERLDFAMNFTKENIDKIMEMGYYEARRTLMSLPSYHYCVRDMDEGSFNDFLLSFDEETIRKVVKLCGLKPHKSHEANIEDILDIMRDGLGLTQKTKDTEVFINFLEKFALLFKVNRFRFYDLTEFYEIVMLYCKNEVHGINNLIEMLMGNHDIKGELKDIFIALYKQHDFGKKDE